MLLSPVVPRIARTFLIIMSTAAAVALLVALGARNAQAATVADCVAGEYFDADSETCVPADKGFFVADDAAPDQTPCPSGRYQDQTGQSSCKDVPAGSEATGAASDGTEATGVRLCPVGTFQDEPLKATCKPIPLGMGGIDADDDGRGATATADCEPGSFRGDAGTTRCTTAPKGTFVSASSATASSPCPVGRYQDETGATACKDVPAGSEGTGTASDGTRATGVRLCLAGTFQPAALGGACTPAPAGSFVAAAGAKEATPCPVGQFQPDTGKSSCTPAPAGSHVPVTGATAAALCPPGSFSSSTGASTCTPAAVGYYVPRPGSTAQLRCLSATEPGLAVCPAPTVTPTPERDAPETGDEPLSAQGDECPPGTWSPTGTSRAGSTCTPASPGTFVASPGATAEEPCPAGTFSDDFGATECTPAPVGTFVASPGAMDPVACPGAMEPGMTVCPEVAALPIEQLEDPVGRTSVWWWIGGLTLVLAAGGAGFVLVQRRTGALDAAVTIAGAGAATLADLPGIDTTSSDLRAVDPSPTTSSSTPDVLEWDEALDGVLDDEQDPPPNPT